MQLIYSRVDSCMNAWIYVSRQIYFGLCHKEFGSWLSSLRQDGIFQARCGLLLFCLCFSIGFTQGRKIEAAGQGVGLSRMEMAESCVPSVKIVSWCVNSGLLDQKNKHQICSWKGQLEGSSLELPFTNSRFSGPQDRDGYCWNTAARGTGQVLVGITGTLPSELRVPGILLLLSTPIRDSQSTLYWGPCKCASFTRDWHALIHLL